MLWTLPNTLTVFRLLAAPVVALAFLALPRPHADWVALILFLGAALTDYADGRLARARDQVSRFGAMLDPIADKAMAVIALAMLLALQGATAVLVVPAVAILFREVFVSGLRGFLGDIAGKLNVTPLAKWKTLAQMLAIALLFAQGLLDHYFHAQIPGADRALAGQAPADGLADSRHRVGQWQLAEMREARCKPRRAGSCLGTRDGSRVPNPNPDEERFRTAGQIPSGRHVFVVHAYIPHRRRWRIHSAHQRQIHA